MRQLDGALSPANFRIAQLQQDLAATRSALASSRAQCLILQESEMRARCRALHDDLTGPPNRHYYHQCLEQAFQRKGTAEVALAVLHLDLNGLKHLTESHEHSAGDPLLRIATARLRRAVRAADTVSRVGEDAFACVLSGMAGRAPLRRLACQLLDALAAPVALEGTEYRIQVSIGIAIRPAVRVTASELMQRADFAMYRANQGQTGYAFFDGFER